VLLTARLGESVGVTTDPYRIILELPRNVDRKMLEETILSIRSESVEGLIRLMVKNSTYLRWRFVYVAKKFGVVEKDADYRAIRFSKLFEIYQDSPLYEEAVAKVLWEDLDLDDTRNVLGMLEDGRIAFEVSRVTPIGRAGLQHSKEHIQPQRADHSILMALKKRLEDEVMHLSCLSCRNQWRVRAKDAPPKASCPRCGARMVAALQGYNRDSIRLLAKKELSDEELKETRKLSKNANLVMEYGDRAVVTLAGRGIGPDTAARILRGLYENEDEFLRDILSAEIHYARTKRFWD
jgi:ATP-dependent Lhr-like helicase